MHPRADIRAAIMAALAPLVPSPLAALQASRVYPFGADQFPAAAVFSPREPTQRLDVGSEIERQATFVILVTFSATEALEDEADALALAIEQAMGADPRLDRTALDSWLALTEIGLSGEGERQVAMLRLSYTVRYVTGASPG